MNYRLNARVIAFVGVFVVAAGALFIYTLLLAPTERDVPADLATTTTREAEQLITARHKVVGTAHTVAGSVGLPTPCHTVVVEPFFVDAGTSTVELRFSTGLSGDVCAAKVTDVPFWVTFTADPGAELRATWNGAPATLNLVPVGPNEPIEGGVPVKG